MTLGRRCRGIIASADSSNKVTTHERSIASDLSNQMKTTVARYQHSLYSYYFHFIIKPVLFYKVGKEAPKKLRPTNDGPPSSQYFGGLLSHLIE